MKILAFDSSSAYASVAVTDTTLLHEETWIVDRRHSRELAPAIERILQNVEFRIDQLDAIAVGLGPGSYTGIRIGLALAQGLALGGGIPVVGVSTLEVLAYSCCAWPGPIGATVALGLDQTGLGLFHGPWYEWRRLQPDRAIPNADLTAHVPENAIICGWDARIDGQPDQLASSRQLGHRYVQGRIPRAANLAVLAEMTIEAGIAPALSNLEPNYLRKSTPEERAEIQGVPY